LIVPDLDVDAKMCDVFGMHEHDEELPAPVVFEGKLSGVAVHAQALLQTSW